MPRPYHPVALANEFILTAGDFGVSHMKLQKLVYCAHGWWLTRDTNSSIVNEDPEVWRHGPVFPSLYKIMSGFGSNRINSLQQAVFNQPPPRLDDADPDESNLIRFVWARYGHMSAFDLSDLTHRQGTPWQQTAARYNYRVPTNTSIPQQMIRDEFCRIARAEAA